MRSFGLRVPCRYEFAAKPLPAGACRPTGFGYPSLHSISGVSRARPEADHRRPRRHPFFVTASLRTTDFERVKECSRHKAAAHTSLEVTIVYDKVDPIHREILSLLRIRRHLIAPSHEAMVPCTHVGLEIGLAEVESPAPPHSTIVRSCVLGA